MRERGILFGVGEIWRLRDSSCVGGLESQEGWYRSIFKTIDGFDDCRDRQSSGGK